MQEGGFLHLPQALENLLAIFCSQPREFSHDLALAHARKVYRGLARCKPWGPPRDFGLGDATVVNTIRIEWPSGIVQELVDVPVNQILTVTEPARLIPQGAGAFQIQNWINQAFDVEASTDLTGGSNVATVTNLTGTLVLQDAVTGEHKCRYYRVVTK